MPVTQCCRYKKLMLVLHGFYSLDGWSSMMIRRNDVLNGRYDIQVVIPQHAGW